MTQLLSNPPSPVSSLAEPYANRCRATRGICFFVGALLLLAAQVSAQEKITFKRLPAAILKMDGKQVKLWDIFQAEKRHVLLVQLGRRYLMVNIKDREILEIDPGAVASKPKEEIIVTRNADGEKTVETDAWNIRNVGPALAIKVFLTKEGRQLEIQLPQRPDERRNW